jgi:ElaB/YqjD/DUF883 family membrane-anchored ribosome-binding protein
MESDVMKSPEGLQRRTDKVARSIEGTAADAGEMARDMGNRVGAKVQNARQSLTQAQTAVSDGARQAAEFTDEYVRMNPWKSLGIAAAAGLLIGILMARR